MIAKEKNREYQRNYYQRNREKVLQRNAAYHAANTEKRKLMVKKTNLRMKLKAIDHYSLGKRDCACCGEKNLGFLCLDHINNDGAAHRKVIGKHTKLARWVALNNFPVGFQVLCFNCNIGRSNRGECPHKNPDFYENL